MAVQLGSIANHNSALPNEAELAWASHRTKMYALQSHAGDLLPNHRVAGCLKYTICGDPVSLWHSPEHDKAFYGGLQQCASVWACPLCAAKITARRKDEIQQGIDIWEQRGGVVGMLTLTFSHHKNESCEKVRKDLAAARKRFWNDRRARNWRARWRVAGTNSNQDATYGQNGWHLHMHVLLFLEAMPDDLEAMISEGEAIWEHIVRGQGRKTHKKYGFDLQVEKSNGNEAIAQYLLKFGEITIDWQDKETWGQAEEMTKAHMKQPKNGNRTIWQLLYDSMMGDEEAGALWVEYQRAFSGKPLTKWGKGFKKELFGDDDQEEKTDVELVAERRELGNLLMMITREAWRKIRGNGIRADLLDIADRGDGQAVVEFLADFGIERDQIFIPQDFKPAGTQCECGAALQIVEIGGEIYDICEDCLEMRRRPPP